jgi:hypothetical protein
MNTSRPIVLSLIWIGLGLSGCQKDDKVVQRPETVVSLRAVLYDNETYAQLDSLWEEYNN